MLNMTTINYLRSFQKYFLECISLIILFIFLSIYLGEIEIELLGIERISIFLFLSIYIYLFIHLSIYICIYLSRLEGISDEVDSRRGSEVPSELLRKLSSDSDEQKEVIS